MYRLEIDTGIYSRLIYSDTLNAFYYSARTTAWVSAIANSLVMNVGVRIGSAWQSKSADEAAKPSLIPTNDSESRVNVDAFAK